MSALGSLVVKLALDHAEYTQGLDRTSQEALKFAHNAQRGFDQASSSARDFLKGVALNAASAVSAMFAVNASITKSLEFSKSMAQISTQLDGASEDLTRLESAAKRMSVQFGTMPVDQTRAFYEIISSGTSDAAKATDLLGAANKLAIGGMTDLATSVNGLTNIMNSYSGKVDSAEAVSDALFVAMKAGKATMEELSSGLGKVTPIASALNVGFDELSATVAALSKQGISTSESITGVRAILASVAKPTKEASDLSEKLGIKFDAAGLQAKGFAGFLDDIAKKTGGSADKLALLFGGVEALIPIMALSGQAGKDFNQIMLDMQTKTGATQDAFDKMAASPGFKIDKLMSSINNIAITLGDSLASVLAPAAEKAAIALNGLFGVNKKTFTESDQLKQKIADMTGELESLNTRKGFFGPLGDLVIDRKKFDELSQRIDDSIQDLARLESAAQDATDAVNNGPGIPTPKVKPEIENGVLEEQNRKNKEALKLAKIAASDRAMEAKQALENSLRIIDSLKRETAEIGLNVAQKKMLSAAAEAAKAPNKELAQQIMANAQAWAVATQKQEDLQAAEKKRISGLEAIEEAEKRASRASQEAARRSAAEWNQLWGGVEQTAKMAFVQFAAHGRSSMEAIGDSIKVAIMDVLYQLTVRKWVIQIGASMSDFAGMTAANASGIGGTGVSGMLTGGATLSSLFGKSATQSAAEKGALASWGNSGVSKGGFLSRIFGSAGGVGLGQAGGVVAALGAGLGVGSSIAGNKKIFGMDGMTTAMIGTVLGGPVGAVIAGAFNALFGRGPYKFRQQVALGTASDEGFDGRVTDIFRSKGGLFVSNKHKEQPADNQDELVNLFDSTTKEFSRSAKDFAENLGLSADSISNYSKAIRIESEKGKALTQEAIQDALTSIGSDFAHGLIPEIDKLKKSGESAFDALTRLNTEFITLIDVGTALGHSLNGTRDFIKSASFEQRSAFIDAAGGMDVLANNAKVFSENFLTVEERLKPAQESLNEQLGKLGLSTDLTRDQFKSLVQSFGNIGGVSEQMLQSLLKLAPAFVQVRTTQEQLAQATLDAARINQQAAISNLTPAYSSLENAVNKERQKSQESYQMAIDASSKSIQGVTESISKLKSFGESLKSTINSIDPMRSEFAKAQINTAIQTGRIDPDKLLSAVDSVKNIDSSKFTNSFDFEREQIKSAMLLGDLNDAVGAQVDKQQAQLNSLNTQKDLLDAGFKNEMSRLDGILETAKMQLDTLSGINTSIIDLAAAIGMFNRTISQAGMAPSIGGGIISGNAGISNQQINVFLKTPGLSDMDIYKAAKENGVSFEQFSTATGKNLQDLYKWAEANGVPKFESGTEYVPNTGLAIVHKGEKIIPANQNNQREVVVELRAIRDAIIKSNQEVIKRLGDSNKNMRAVMSGNASFRTSSAS